MGYKLDEPEPEPEPEPEQIELVTDTLSEITLDLDLDHYSLEDLYRLFNIYDCVINEPNLKTAKQIVLKMHPDKSRLDAKYFLFFSKAYKRI